jgi:ribosomal protein L7/L12
VPSDQENIAELQRQVRHQGELIDALYRRLGITDLGLADQPPTDVLDALYAGNLIEAIKRYREHTGVGLKEAKNAVEALSRGL